MAIIHDVMMMLAFIYEQDHLLRFPIFSSFRLGCCLLCEDLLIFSVCLSIND